MISERHRLWLVFFLLDLTLVLWFTRKLVFLLQFFFKNFFELQKLLLLELIIMWMWKSALKTFPNENCLFCSYIIKQFITVHLDGSLAAFETIDCMTIFIHTSKPRILIFWFVLTVKNTAGKVTSLDRVRQFVHNTFNSSWIRVPVILKLL